MYTFYFDFQFECSNAWGWSVWPKHVYVDKTIKICCVWWQHVYQFKYYVPQWDWVSHKLLERYLYSSLGPSWPVIGLTLLFDRKEDSLIPLACAECDDSMPLSGASSIPLCYVLFPATLLHQLFFRHLSAHLASYFLVYLSILLFPNSYIIPFWEFYFLPFSQHAQTNVIYLTLLTPWCRVLLEKLTGLQLVTKFPAFRGTWSFITALTSIRHLSLSWASPIQSIYPHPTSWRSILMLSTHVRLLLPSGLLPSGFPTKTLYAPLSSPIHATCPAHPI